MHILLQAPQTECSSSVFICLQWQQKRVASKAEEAELTGSNLLQNDLSEGRTKRKRTDIAD